MALDKYQDLKEDYPFMFESNIYIGGSRNADGGGSTTILPIDVPIKWQPTVTDVVVAPAPDTAVVLPTETPKNEVATTDVPKVISIIQGAVNGIAGALGAGTVATPPFVAPNSNQAAIDAAVNAKQKNFIVIGVVILVLIVLSYFAFKKK